MEHANVCERSEVKLMREGAWKHSFNRIVESRTHAHTQHAKLEEPESAAAAAENAKFKLDP